MLTKKSEAGVRRRAVVATALVLPLTACAVGGSGNADDSFYGGENVDLVVPYDPGGGYDVYARAMAPVLGECLDATVAVRNEPGAGGLVATNQTALTSADEPRLQILNMGGFVASQLAEADGVRYDMREFSYAGRIASAPDLVAAGPGSDLDSFEDVVDAEGPIRFVSTGVGSLESISASVLIAAYDIPGEIVTGFSGSDEARTAVTAGNADLHSLPFDSHLGALDSGDIEPVVLLSDQQQDLLPDAPLITDFAAEGNSQDLVDSLVTLGELGRAVAGPPGMSEEQIAELREGFQCAIQDEDLLDQLEEQRRPVVPADAKEVDAQLEDIFGASPEFIDAVRGAFR